MRLLFLSIVVLLSVALVQADSLHYVDWLEVKTTVKNPVNFTTTASFELDYLTVNFSWIPMTSYRQSIEELYLSQEGYLEGSNYVIEIVKPEDFVVEIVSVTNTTSNPVEVPTKIPFPIQSLSQDLMQYTLPTELIDIDEDIRIKASMIAGDTDDLYRVVFDIATWVNTNVEYNLSTLTAQATLPSSWVLEHRQGVCDEISNLFISMLRSLGIPARYVSGMSYTESELFDENWGAHGWAEVYFPTVGWIPFDPTYNQLGFVDATHVKFNHGVDSSKYANTFTWRARNVDVSPGSLSLVSEVLSSGSKRDDDVSIKVFFESEQIGFNSYNVVTAQIQNKRPYYVARSFNTALVRELNLLSPARVDVLLEPNQVKTISWLVYVSELDRSLIYTFPTTVYSSMGERTTQSFEVVQSGLVLSNTYVQADKDLSDLDFSCKIISSGYIHDSAIANCQVTLPSEEVALVCFEEECSAFELTEGFNEFNFDIDLSIGYRTYVFSYKGFDSAVSFVPFNTIDDAKIIVEILDFKKVSDYSDQRFDVILTRDSFATPQNVRVTFGNNLHQQFYKIDRVHTTNTLPLGLPSNYFTLKNTDLHLTVVYEDVHGKEYEIKKSLSFDFENISLFDRLKLFVNSVNSALIGLFN